MSKCTGTVAALRSVQRSDAVFGEASGEGLTVGLGKRGGRGGTRAPEPAGSWRLQRRRHLRKEDEKI